MPTLQLNTLDSIKTLPLKKDFLMIENYIYLYHIDKYIILPSFVDRVNDLQGASFSTSLPLSRSAPIFSYQYTLARTIQLNFNLHRDLMYEINKNLNNIPTENPGDDYVDLFIRYIQAAALPVYSDTSKMVNPPIVAVRLGNDIFIKGIVNGSVSLTYSYPILSNGRYANVGIQFSVSEIDPYDAQLILTIGSFRSVNTSLARNNINVSGDAGYAINGSSGRDATAGVDLDALNAGNGNYARWLQLLQL